MKKAILFRRAFVSGRFSQSKRNNDSKQQDYLDEEDELNGLPAEDDWDHRPSTEPASASGVWEPGMDPYLGGGEPDPEDFRPSPKPKPSPLQQRPRTQSLFWTSVILTIVISFSSIHWDAKVAQDLSVSQAALFSQGEWWRAFTAIFCHSDTAHLMSNMPFLIIFSWLLANYFGALVFPGLALVCAALANVLTVLFYGEQTRLLGASGLVYVMFGLWLIYYMRYATHLRLSMRTMRAIAFFLVIVFPTSYEPNTSYLCHAFGFILGLGAGVLSLPYSRIRTEHENSDSQVL